MDKHRENMAEQLAKAAWSFVQQTTGHAPKNVDVILRDQTLVITLHGALSPAEQALSKDPHGAAQVQELHRQLFANASKSLREAVKRITGVEVREAASEVDGATGKIIKVFTTGTVVQVFLLDSAVPTDTWSGIVPVAKS